MDNHPTESLNEETSQPVNDGKELDISLRGKPFANWKEERLYLREKWGAQGRKVEFQGLINQVRRKKHELGTSRRVRRYFYHKSGGIAKVTINRPHKRNAFQPKTVSEMYAAFLDAREDPKIGVVLLTGAGSSFRWKICLLFRWGSKCAWRSWICR